MNFKNYSVYIFAIALLISAVGCKKEQNGSLSGSVLSSKEVMISEILPKELRALDTLSIVDGKFVYDREFLEPTFLLLEFESGIRLPVLINKGEQINLTIIDTTEYGTFIATGSNSIERMAHQRDLFAKSLIYRDSLEYLNYIYQDSANIMQERVKWNDGFVAQVESHRNALKAMIDEDSTDLSNIMVFYQSLGQLEIFNFEEDFEYYRKVDNGLRATFSDNEHVLYFHQQLEKYKEAVARQEEIKLASENIAVGSPAPEIELPNIDGQMLKLSDLKGKIVLVDFWASWCGPCRRANPDLVAMYKKYNAKGFEIFSVSLDGIDQQANAKNDWRFAIEKDGLIWPNQVSDLKGYESSVIAKYGFEGIPFTVLLDREGKIIAKNLRGAELEAAVNAAVD